MKNVYNRDQRWKCQVSTFVIIGVWLFVLHLQLVAPLKKGYDGIFRHDPCSMYDRDYRNMTYDDVRQALSALADNRSTGAAKKHLPCEYWEYDDTQYQSTIVSEVRKTENTSILFSLTLKALKYVSIIHRDQRVCSICVIIMS